MEKTNMSAFKTRHFKAIEWYAKANDCKVNSLSVWPDVSLTRNKTGEVVTRNIHGIESEYWDYRKTVNNKSKPYKPDRLTLF